VRHFVGIDENGMGPRLGPLIVTSVLARVDDGPLACQGAKLVASRPRGAIAKRIGDSKKLVAFEDSTLGEAWARAIAARAGVIAKTPAELIAAVGLDSEATLREPCPSHHADLCWSDEGEAFAADDKAVRACAKDLERLAAKGVHVIRTRVAILCARRLNEGVARGLSRFDLDLHTMERLALDARDAAAGEVHALCGKVGGFDFYADRFGPLAGYLHTVLVEGRARSEYQLPGVGRLAFVRDGDDTHLIIGLASLVGKWARDHLMRRVVRYHRSDDATLPDASGYHDPVTTRFIAASEIIRKNRRVEASCFAREALYPAASTASTTSSEPEPKKPPRAPRKPPNPREPSPPPPPRPQEEA
jgi:ribonuclease HII